MRWRTFASSRHGEIDLYVGAGLSLRSHPGGHGSKASSNLLGAVGAVGRAFGVVVGGLGVVLAIAYTTKAGVDWPRETAGRILVIGAVIGTFLVAAVGLSSLEGRLAELWPFSCK